MAGRKRKAGARTPSGQLSRAGQESALAPTAVKRLLSAAIAKASDPRLGSEVGRLLLADKLTARQAAAAWKFAEVRAQYESAIEAPRVKSPQFERGAKASPPDEQSAAGQAIAAKTRQAVRRYERAHAVLAACGQDAERAVRLLVGDVALVGYEPLTRARDALDALASHFAAR